MTTEMFAVRCDPPYEDLDGGCGERLETVTRHELPGQLASLANMAGRLDPGQVPMLIEVRRLS